MFDEIFKNTKGIKPKEIKEQLIVNDEVNSESKKVEVLTKALEDLLKLMTGPSSGRMGNPYSKPEVDAAFKALGRDWRNESKVKEAKLNWFTVYLNGKEIDKLQDQNDDPEDVKRSLVNHDGYDPNIVVKKSK